VSFWPLVLAMVIAARKLPSAPSAVVGSGLKVASRTRSSSDSIRSRRWRDEGDWDRRRFLGEGRAMTRSLWLRVEARNCFRECFPLPA